MMNKKKNYHIKPDYQCKNLKNPFYKQKQKVKKTKAKKIFLLLFPILILVFLLWFFLASNVWKIKTITILDLTRINEDELKEIAVNREELRKFIFFNESNIFLFSKNDFRADVLDKYNFSDLHVRKIFPSTIELKIFERPYSFIFQEGTEFYYASADGYIIKESIVSEDDKNNYFILENKSDAIYISDKNKLNLNQEFLSFTFLVDQELAKFPDLNPFKYIIDQELNTLIAQFKDGPSVLFNVKNNPIEQAADLALVKNEKIKDNFNSTNYIDLRYGNRIFIND